MVIKGKTPQCVNSLAEPGPSCSKARKEGLNTGVKNQLSNSIKINRQPVKRTDFEIFEVHRKFSRTMVYS